MKDIFKTRRAVRKYTDQRVPEDIIDQIIEDTLAGGFTAPASDTPPNVLIPDMDQFGFDALRVQHF